MKSLVWSYTLYVLFSIYGLAWTRQGMTIDKLECACNPSVCLAARCNLKMATNDPFNSTFSFDCNMTRSCSSIYVKLKNFVQKTKTVYTLTLENKMDVCSVLAGAKNPLLQTFFANLYDSLDTHLPACPWGPGLFRVADFSIDGTNRGNLMLKKTGRYRTQLEFTCGQKIQLFTLKFYGNRNLTTAD